jgi:hypothetical protein
MPEINGVEQSAIVTDAEWQVAVETLCQLLQRSREGLVSSVAVRKELEKKGAGESRALVIRLKHFDFDHADTATAPATRWRHHGWNFFTEEAFARTLSKTESEADSAAAEAATALAEEDDTDDEGTEEPRARRSARQEEARLVRYVVDALSDLYSSEFASPDMEIAFDVHSDRGGSDYENVDAIAIHWRAREIVDLVSVEVKLSFTAKLAQQANNYRRFSDRVWAAVPVQAPVAQAATELRDMNPRLFEYFVNSGIGILACRKSLGRSYEVFPVQWPTRCVADPCEREAFIERHRDTFEAAGVVAPRARTFPKLR